MANVTERQAQVLRSEVERLQDLLDRRPAINAGLVESYIEWTRLVYASDIAAAGRLDAEVH